MAICYRVEVYHFCTKEFMNQPDSRIATTVRMSDEIHYLARIEAAKQRMSLSEYVASVLAKAVQQANKAAK